MRKRSLCFISFVFVILCLGTLSQAQPAIEKVKQPAMAFRTELDRHFLAYEVFRIDPKTLSSEIAETGLLLATIQGVTYELQLEPNDLRAPGAVRTITEKSGLAIEDETPVYTYRGVVAGYEDSIVRILAAPDGLSGMIRFEGQVFYIESGARFLAKGGTQWAVLYRSTDVKPEALATCKMTSLQKTADEILQDPGIWEKLATTAYVVQIATEADVSFYQNHQGQNINTLISGYVNVLDGIWQDQLNLRAQISYQNYYTSTDPYSNTVFGHGPKDFPGLNNCVPNEGSGLWEQFRDYWNQYRTTVTRDIAVLFTGRDLKICSTSGHPQWELFGTAGIGGTVCANPSNAYVVMEEYPANTAGLMAHEIGHSLSNGFHDENYCDPRCGLGQNSDKPVLCGTVGNSSDEYSSATKIAIWEHVRANHGCLSTTFGSQAFFGDNFRDGIGVFFYHPPTASRWASAGKLGDCSVQIPSVSCLSNNSSRQVLATFDGIAGVGTWTSAVWSAYRDYPPGGGNQTVAIEIAAHGNDFSNSDGRVGTGISYISSQSTASCASGNYQRATLNGVINAGLDLSTRKPFLFFDSPFTERLPTGSTQPIELSGIKYITIEVTMILTGSSPKALLHIKETVSGETLFLSSYQNAPNPWNRSGTPRFGFIYYGTPDNGGDTGTLYVKNILSTSF